MQQCKARPSYEIIEDYKGKECNNKAHRRLEHNGIAVRRSESLAIVFVETMNQFMTNRLAKHFAKKLIRNISQDRFELFK